MEPDFSAVWSRVTGMTLPETPEDQLRRFLKLETETAAALKASAGLACDPSVRKQLMELQQETCRQIKRLRAALYLVAGECESPAPVCRKGSKNLLSELKGLYEACETTAAAYRTAGRKTDRTALETLYSSQAEAKERHAASLLELTERLL